MMEAKVLNRTLILPDALLLMQTHSFQDGDVFKPLRDILNITRLQKYVDVVVTPAPNKYVDDLVEKEWRTVLMAPRTLFADVRLLRGFCGAPHHPPSGPGPIQQH